MVSLLFAGLSQFERTKPGFQSSSQRFKIKTPSVSIVTEDASFNSSSFKTKGYNNE